MLKIIKDLLLKIANDIDCGNSNISDTEALELVDVIKRYTDKTQRLSKYQSYQYLNISRATFDNYVREGLLPRGKKEAGLKELFWTKKDLDEFIKSRNNDKRKV